MHKRTSLQKFSIIALLGLWLAAFSGLVQVEAAPQKEGVQAQSQLWYIDKFTLKPERAAGKTRTEITPLLTTGPTGYGPSDIKTAYNYTASVAAGAGKTIALVDAGSSADIYNDLKTFSQYYGLPVLPVCGSGVTGACFKQVNAQGDPGKLPPSAGWEYEIALDVEWAHAIAPGASITLVAADNNYFDPLFAAIDYAKNNADYVSMSWGAGEWSTAGSYYDSHFINTTRLTSFFVASGDSGGYSSTPASGTQPWYPATSAYVISVGGTTLTRTGSTSFKETGWSGSGGGCSFYERANRYQAQFRQYPSSCGGRRAVPDVALDADPNTGVAVYITENSTSQGWAQIGGTSLSAPMWAARSAVSGMLVDAKYVYGNKITFRDIISGSNGTQSCRSGFDMVTGRGSWIR